MNAIDRPRLIRLAQATAELKKRQLKREFAGSGGLLAFVRYFWPILEPATHFVDGWAIEAICEHLEAVTDGRITRILINVPPGFCKSLLCNCFWPAWEWSARGQAHHRYVTFSYSSSLTERDNDRFTNLILSPQFQELYGDKVKVSGFGKVKVTNKKTGWKFASSVQGVGTGERGTRIILDDPHNVREAESDAIRTSTVTWFREAMQNRLNDLATGSIVVIMQRVHEADVSGCIIENYPEYEHLMIPMEFEVGRGCETSIGWVDPRDEDGELAWPERYPPEVLGPFQNLPFMWAGQYQQRPEPRGGGILKRDYWRIWDREAQRENDVKPGTFPIFEFVIASFDGAFTEKQENDYSALTVWGVWASRSGHPQVMLVDAWQKRLTLHGSDPSPQKFGESVKDYELRKQDSWGVVEHIANTCRKNKIDKLIIESKATGHTVAQEMRRLYAREPWTVQLIDPGRLDKVARAYSIQHLFADGMIWRPDTDWAEMVEDNCASFPRGAHDDLVDTATMALNHLRRVGFALRRDEADAAEADRQYGRPRGRVLYGV